MKYFLTLIFLISTDISFAENIKIGVITSSEPSAEVWSSSANLGLELAVTEINQQGGVAGQQIQLIFEDDRLVPHQAVLAYHKLREQNKVDFIIGPQFDQTLAPVIPLAEKDRQLLITTITTNPVNKQKNSWIVHSAPHDKFLAQELASYILKKGHKKILCLVAEESYNQNFANYLLPYLKEIQTETVYYPVEQSDFTQLFLRLKRYQPDGLVFFFYSPATAVNAYKKLKELDIRLPVYSNEILHGSEEFIKTSGAQAQGTVYMLSKFNESSQSVESILNKLSVKPALPLYTIVAYDTIHWLKDLINKYGNDSVKIKAAISGLDYQGLAARYRFDEFGDLIETKVQPYKITSTGYQVVNEH